MVCTTFVRPRGGRVAPRPNRPGTGRRSPSPRRPGGAGRPPARQALLVALLVVATATACGDGDEGRRFATDPLPSGERPTAAPVPTRVAPTPVVVPPRVSPEALLMSRGAPVLLYVRSGPELWTVDPATRDARRLSSPDA